MVPFKQNNFKPEFIQTRILKSRFYFVQTVRVLGGILRGENVWLDVRKLGAMVIGSMVYFT